MALKSFFRTCVDLVFPLRCAACRRVIPSNPGIPLCPACSAAVRKNVPPFCRTCGRTIGQRSPGESVCPVCARRKPFFNQAFSLFLYEGPVKALVKELKYRGKDHLGKTLGGLMADFIEEYGLPGDAIDGVVPVPLHTAKLREREFNQAHLLAREIARRIDKPLFEKALTRCRNTKSQTGLRQDERLHNMEEAFKAERNTVNGKNILLVDDVMTTGATVSEAALALKQAGARLVTVLTLAN